MPKLPDLFKDFLANATPEEIEEFRQFQKRKLLTPPVEETPIRTRGTLLPPTRPHPVYGGEVRPLIESQGSGSYVPPMPVDDPLAMVPPPPAPDPLQARLISAQQRSRELRDLENNPVKNNDRGWAGRLGDILRQFVISAGQQYNQSDPRLPADQRLMGALGGGIAGSVYGGFHPQVDEERKRMYDYARSKQNEAELGEQLKQRQTSYKSQQEALARQHALLRDQPVQVVDPITGQPVFVKGSEAYSQGQQSLRQQAGFENAAIRQQAGFENQAEHQRRGQAFQRTENQKTRENNWQIAVASAQTQAERTRVENEIQADRDFLSSVDDYYKRKNDRTLEIAKLAGTLGGGQLLTDTLVQQAGSYLARARELDEQISLEASKGAGTWTSAGANQRTIQSLTRQRDDLLKQADAVNLKLAAQAGQSGSHASQIEALQRAEREDRYPTRRTVPIYKPTVPQRPNSGYSVQGKVYPSPSALRRAFPGKSDAEIRQLIESQGGKFQN